MHLPNKEEVAFTKRNNLPRFKFVDEVHKNNTLTQVRKIGKLVGSKGLTILFPEFERATLGQLIRYYG